MKIGDRVKHPVFGTGTIRQDSGPEEWASESQSSSTEWLYVDWDSSEAWDDFLDDQDEPVFGLPKGLKVLEEVGASIPGLSIPEDPDLKLRDLGLQVRGRSIE